MINCSKKEIENILYQLHESFFIDYAIKNNDLIFRVAINCAIENKLHINCEYGEKYYIYDIICLDYKNLKTNCDDKGKIQLNSILGFSLYNDEYLFMIENLDDEIDFTFDCSNIKWEPIILINGDDLELIQNTKYSKI